MRWRSRAQPLRLALVDLGHHHLAYAAAIAHAGLGPAELDALEDLDVLLMAEVLDDVVHGELGMGERSTARSSTGADQVTLTPAAGGRCVQCAASSLPRGGPALRPRRPPRRVIASLAGLLDRRAGPLLSFLSHRTVLRTDGEVAASRRAAAGADGLHSRHGGLPGHAAWVLLNGLRAIGAPCLRLGGEPTVCALRRAGEGTRCEVLTTEGAQGALRSLKALHSQLVHELLEPDADLLCHGGLHGDLLRQLPEQQHDLLCRMLCARMAGKGAEERVVRERTRRERSLHERTRIHACQSGLVTEGHIGAVVCAGLPEQAGTHLRPTRSLQSRKLRYETLRGKW